MMTKIMVEKSIFNRYSRHLISYWFEPPLPEEAVFGRDTLLEELEFLLDTTNGFVAPGTVLNVLSVFAKSLFCATTLHTELAMPFRVSAIYPPASLVVYLILLSGHGDVPAAFLQVRQSFKSDLREAQTRGFGTGLAAVFCKIR